MRAHHVSRSIGKSAIYSSKILAVQRLPLPVKWTSLLSSQCLGVLSLKLFSNFIVEPVIRNLTSDTVLSKNIVSQKSPHIAVT